MRTKEIVDSTTNRREFNHAYKEFLEVSKGEIHCSWCAYHRGENDERKWYGGIDHRLRHPNWKLVSKNRKQWMGKPIKIITESNINRNREYTSIKF